MYRPKHERTVQESISRGTIKALKILGRQRHLKWTLLVIGSFVVTVVVLDQFIFPLPKDKLYRPNATFVYSREGKLLNAFTSSDKFWRKPVKLEQISPRLITGVIATEDKYFYWHPGVNPISLFKAAVVNLREGRIVRGGSTITMQIARMMEPKSRTIPYKLFEIFRAFQLEYRYSKSNLLELYFNLAPYGGNIEGVSAAAHFYFEKEPHELTWSEAALLTAVPGSPEKLRPDKCLECGEKRLQVILKRWRDQELISLKEYLAALSEKLPSQRLSIPDYAPHWSVSLHAQYPDSSTLISTVNFEKQIVCERLAQLYSQKYKAKDIHNLAMVVIDNRNSQIVALIGSPNFRDSLNNGQVDASLAPRSPGSALKPFVYAQAFDNGTLSPQMIVADIPINYSGYRPVNYDESYRGVVSVREALIQSLNVPAVNAAADNGLFNLYTHLQQGGISTLERPHYEYGLPLVLGACEIKLTELANLYATFARNGTYLPLKSLLGDKTNHQVHLYSEGVCKLVTDILVDVKRPDLPEGWESAAARFPIAWKTGTSYGRRDAWAIGYNPVYTVGVWAGNCSGEGSVDLVGAAIAAPVMFDVFSQVAAGEDNFWFEPSYEVGTRNVCAVSGQPAGRFCEEQIPEEFLIGKSPTATCSVHRPIYVDRQSGLRLKAHCTNFNEFETKIIEQWPQQVATWFVQNGKNKQLPPYDPNCLATNDGLNPTIISPEPGAVFEIVEDISPEYQKICLQASVASGDGMVHWFLDGKHLWAVRAGKSSFYVPQKGRHTLLCIDDAGRSSTVNFTVN